MKKKNENATKCHIESINKILFIINCESRPPFPPPKNKKK